MLHYIKNGHDATAVPVIRGTGVANRHATKKQRAALAAAVLAGDVDFTPSQRQLASIFGVSVAYVGLARQFSPAKRKAIIAGEATINFTTLLNGPKAPLALPAPKLVSDAELEEVIRIAGIDRTLTAAVAVETYTAA
jgi:hypothetical protein